MILDLGSFIIKNCRLTFAALYQKNQTILITVTLLRNYLILNETCRFHHVVFVCHVSIEPTFNYQITIFFFGINIKWLRFKLRICIESRMQNCSKVLLLKIFVDVSIFHLSNYAIKLVSSKILLYLCNL